MNELDQMQNTREEDWILFKGFDLNRGGTQAWKDGIAIS